MLFFAILTVSIGLHCVSGNDSSVEKAKQEVISAESAFAFDLYEVIRREAGTGNALVCPLSVSNVLTLILEGAGGSTAQELRDVLHMPGWDLTRVAQGYRALKMSMQVTGDNEAELHTADKIFLPRGGQLSKRFKKMAVDYFAAEAEEMNFEDSERARAEINRWVERKTEGKIKELFPEGSPSSNTLLLIVNAIYMKAAWMKTFRKQETKDEEFHTLAGFHIMTPMMNKRGEFQFGEIPQVNSTMVVLHYMGFESRLRMLVVLPNTVDGLEQLESKLGSINWNNIKLHSRSVQLSLPKFRIEAKHDLKKHLMRMGLNNLFSPGANLSGIAHQRMFVSKALQKTYIDVDEKGTEAAAATGLDMVRFSAPPPRAEFIANHPFIFLVMRDDVVLFMGRVTDPRQTQAS